GAVFWVCLLIAPASLSAVGAGDTSDSLRRFTQQHEERRAELAEQIARVASLAEKQNQPGTAEAILEFALPLQVQTQNVDRLPETKQADLPVGIDNAERHWRSQLRNVRTEYARD